MTSPRLGDDGSFEGLANEIRQYVESPDAGLYGYLERTLEDVREKIMEAVDGRVREILDRHEEAHKRNERLAP